VSGQGTPFARYDTPGSKKVVVTYLATGCKDSCYATIEQRSTKPALSCKGDTITCSDPQATASVTSTPSAGVGYLWTPAPVSGQGTANAVYTTAGIKKVVVTIVETGCKDSCNATIVENITKPVLSCKGDTITCAHPQATASVTSTPSVGVTYLWTPAPVSGQGTKNAVYSSPGTKKVVVTVVATGCKDSCNAVIEQSVSKPVLSCKGDTVTCGEPQATASVTSTPSVGISYLWTPAPMSGQGTANAVYTTAGTKKVVVTIVATGCKDSCNAVIAQDISKPLLTCKGDTITCGDLQATASVTSTPSVGVSYLWTPAPVSGQGTANAVYTTAGTKKVVVTLAATGCKDSCFATIVENVTKPVLSCKGDTITCSEPQATASVTSIPSVGVSYLWTPAPVSGQGTANAVYTTTGTKKVVVTIVATGCKDSCNAVIQELVNHAPVCHVPNDTAITTETLPIQVCLPVYGTDSDGDPVTCEKISGAGTLSGGQWCFTWSAPRDTTVLVSIRCFDRCDTCVAPFHVTILYKEPTPPCFGNSPPICDLPRDTTIYQCMPTTVRLPVSARDINNNLLGCTVISGPGMITSKGFWAYTPVGEETVHVTIRCTDSCDAYCQGSFTVAFAADRLKPLCNPTLDTTIHACRSVPIMIPIYSAVTKLVECYVSAGPGSLVDGYWVYTPATEGVVRATIRCRSVCNEVWQWSLTVRIKLDGTDCEGIVVRTTGDGAEPGAATSSVDPCACPARGDIDGDGDVSVGDLATLADLVYGTVNPLPLGSNCPVIAQCDVNCDGVVDARDVEALTAYVFSQGPAPCDPCNRQRRGSGDQFRR
jgi:hypothetical protein